MGIDYGVIIRGRNPFNPAKTLAIFAGAYGYGTWGGVNMAFEESFLNQCDQLNSQSAETPSNRLRHLLHKYFDHAREFLGSARSSQDWAQFECIFKVNVFDKRPHAPHVIVLRRLP